MGRLRRPSEAQSAVKLGARSEAREPSPKQKARTQPTTQKPTHTLGEGVQGECQ